MSKTKKIQRLLSANRGEIALRIMATCREMGIETISIYTAKETGLPHTEEGTFNVSLGEGSLAETYLNQQKLIQIAKDYGAQAIHPGYGFLSENAEFAEAVRNAGLIFIGPSAKSIRLMGDKVGSKNKMAEIGVPLIPGYHGDDQDPQNLLGEAQKIGFPVLVKASAGGGGKGMRIVHSQNEFLEALKSAKREAKSAFGNDQVLIEKFIQNPRHIEVQVLSDQHGHHLHLFERECSIQRRYQKIVEESPASCLSPQMRKEMTGAAVKITNAIDYEGAGTVELIVDEDGEEGSFYFLEMNTRLQVEHPVTEAVTGLDLVAWQIRIAQSEAIGLSQSELSQRGHAIEVRLYAEDPYNEFLPSTGKIQCVGEASGTLKGIRVDSGYRDGNEVTIDFDPMLAKVIAHAETRDEAAVKLSLGLDEWPFFGVVTNRSYLKKILTHPQFLSGQTFTHFVKTHEKDLSLKTDQEVPAKLKALAILGHEMSKRQGRGKSREKSDLSNESGVWSELSRFRNV